MESETDLFLPYLISEAVAAHFNSSTAAVTSLVTAVPNGSPSLFFLFHFTKLPEREVEQKSPLSPSPFHITEMLSVSIKHGKIEFLQAAKKKIIQFEIIFCRAVNGVNKQECLEENAPVFILAKNP